MITLDIKNESTVHRIIQKKTLLRLLECIVTGEGIKDPLEVSVLFCDDAFMTSLNKQYRNVASTTDVLAFPMDAQIPSDSVRVLGDIVVSMDVLRTRCKDVREAMRQELLLLVCHGMLHLLGYDHDTPEKRTLMQQKQALYLELPFDTVWHS
ncbi:MAG TPA: rRNA maturation RNase YbeY [Candidatus Hydrogenedentes bacterium]|jgi:probable rRNA maturation factor|nr:MAG: Endoribonuclease YbeY [Candidatus Hydrogenedentes bacterium ADurb.Bin170]HNZ47358.1 rRNA maturation RNase YbeY [Candidatus Hydrogenedentota bacterium]HPX85438.1 rRNA maturation RNase YbeY [Candidatus Hydrogenedentota bacterium]HQB03328.1 rRNA maturation RNase YbeY [Candidatus Hydrogenedentota bacterium]